MSIFTNEIRTKYRGTWKKANVMVTLSGLKQRDFEIRATQWFSLRHSNVASLYGACHIANPPFFVYKYDPNGTSLDDFVKDEANRDLVWKKLHESALGISYLHQRQVAHGNLECRNIVISRNGQTKVGGFEVTGPYRPWESPEQLRSERQVVGTKPMPPSSIFVME
uniref:Protein kinase domain-containing protein n=1 Tax=Globisporangium ultimum (strain ATCC 200006 / CBS 805.95 / DAOM BR144) TaxID=431595 RepID=K3XD88_GLOUD